MGLAKNAVLEWVADQSVAMTTPHQERILHLDYTSDKVVLYDINAWNHWPRVAARKDLEQAIALGTVKILPVDPYAHLLLPERDIEKMDEEKASNGNWKTFLGYKAHRNNVYQKLAPALEGRWGDLLDPDQRPGLITRLVKNTHWSRQTVAKYLRRWWQCGQTPNAFLPHYKNCGGPGKERIAALGDPKRGRPNNAVLQNRGERGRNVLPEDVPWVKSVLLPIYEKRNEIDFTAAYKQACKERYSDNEFDFNDDLGIFVPKESSCKNIPLSIHQAIHLCEKYHDKERQAIKRHGSLAWPLQYRSILGDSSSMLIGPGAVYQIDATVLDVYLVSSIDRKRVIGRPVLYVVIDVFSRMVVGFALLLEGPNWEGAKQALLHAYVDKTKQFCHYQQKHQLPISSAAWPSQYLPTVLLADNGELKSILSDELQGALGITVQNPPPYRPDWKAIVERHFKTVADNLKFTPGYVHDRPHRGDPDYRLDAKLTTSALRACLANRFACYNTTHRLKTYDLTPWMIEDGVEPYPAQLWRWGLQNSNAMPRSIAEERVMATLLPSDEGTITPRGIEFRGLHYSCTRAEQERWFVRYARKRGRIPLTWNPQDPQQIYLRLNQGRDIVPCRLVDRAREHNVAEADWFEIVDYFAAKAVVDQDAFVPDLLSQLPYDRNTDQIIQQESELSEDAQKGHSKASRLKDMKQAKSAEVVVDTHVNRPFATSHGATKSSSHDDGEYIGKPQFIQPSDTPREPSNAA